VDPAAEEESAVPSQRSAERVAPVVILVLALTGIAIFGIWTAHDGGFAPEQWLPGALALVGLVLTAAASSDIRARFAAAPGAPLLFILYAIWSYASIGWADVQGDALDGANRTLLYACIYCLFAVLPLRERSRTVVVATWAFTVAAIGVVELVRAAEAVGPRGRFVLGRLASPITYPNANAAVFLMAAVTLAVLASRLRGSRILRIASGATAAAITDLAVLCQSRGSLVALPLTLVAYIAVTRGRLRALAQLAVLTVAVAPAVPALLDVYSAVVNGHAYGTAVTRAAVWVGASAAIGAVGTALLALADSRIEISPQTAAAVGRVIGVVAGVSAAVVVAAALLFGHPARRVTRAWHNFTTNAQAAPQTIHFASGIGTSRYDVWRIALRQFEAHPLVGAGADNYLVGYLQQRRTYETSRYPASVELRAFSETGIVGGVLFFAFLAIALCRVLRAARRDAAGPAALACFVGFSYWFFHASIDWLWEFPALAGAAFALLGLAAGSGGPVRRVRASLPMARFALPAAAAATAAAAAIVLGAPWIAVRKTDAALAIGVANPGRAYGLLRSSARWNPLSDAPAVAEATIAANAGDRSHEVLALHAALKRNPWSWYTYFMLGIVAGREHRLATAHAELEHARRLSPRDLVILYAQRRLGWGKPLTEAEVGSILRLTTRTLRGVSQRP